MSEYTIKTGDLAMFLRPHPEEVVGLDGRRVVCVPDQEYRVEVRGHEADFEVLLHVLPDDPANPAGGVFRCAHLTQWERRHANQGPPDPNAPPTTEIIVVPWAITPAEVDA